MRAVLQRAAIATWSVAMGLGWLPANAQSPASPSATPSTVAAAGRPLVRTLELDLAAAQRALASVPVLAPYASRFVPFASSDADAALRRGGHHRDHIQPWIIAPAAVAWTPIVGKELWVLSGRSGPHVLVAVLYSLGDGHFAHAASTVIEEGDVTVAVGYSEQYPKQLVWSTCYGCAGEGGTIRFGDDERVEITYR